jgi:hypothetical protein
LTIGRAARNQDLLCKRFTALKRLGGASSLVANLRLEVGSRDEGHRADWKNTRAITQGDHGSGKLTALIKENGVGKIRNQYFSART